MADDEGGEKKHAPIERNWNEAAERGQLPRSQDMASGAVLLAGSMALIYGNGPLVSAMRNLVAERMALRDITLDDAKALALLTDALQVILVGVSVPLAAVALASVAVNLAQTGGKMATSALEPNPSRLDPIQGFQQHYMSWTPLVELAKGLAKLGLLGVIAVMALSDTFAALPILSAVPLSTIPQLYVDVARTFILAAVPLLLVLAAGDYGYAYYKVYNELMRTDQQVRQDNKEQEGDPQLRAHRRSVARGYAYRSVLAAVAEADVVVTNPTHYAVALRYRRGEDDAPMVLAKGVDHLAWKIRELADQRSIPRVENRALARALYARVEVGHPIPEDLFLATAKVFAKVYARRKKKRAPAPPPPPPS